MGEANCNFNFLWPGGVDCSGFGICMFDNVTKKSFCMCQEGRRATGDMVFDPIDCDQSELALSICWGLLLVCAGFCALYGTYELIEQAMMPDVKRGLYLNIVLATVAAVTTSAGAILKLVAPDKHFIGEDPVITIFASITALCFWISVILCIDRIFVAVVGKHNISLVSVVTSSAPRYSLLGLVVITFILPTSLCSFNAGKL